MEVAALARPERCARLGQLRLQRSKCGVQHQRASGPDDRDGEEACESGRVVAVVERIDRWHGWIPRLHEDNEGIEKNSENAKQIVEDTAVGGPTADWIVEGIAMESADAEQIAEDVAMEDASVRTENDYIAHGRCQPRQVHARRAGTAASMARGRAMPGRV
mmetsp:Transcript_20036/g.52414  ORF Transcript_20036/g.52414 Transcript_20036/m.52414 type:complete len:161 (+) Transcript_20036:1102-1584(+)